MSVVAGNPDAEQSFQDYPPFTLLTFGESSGYGTWTQAYGPNAPFNKSLGGPTCDSPGLPKPGQVHCGNPIDIGSGNKYERIIDYESAGQNKLTFIRYYNSLVSSNLPISMGSYWRSNYDRYLNIASSSAVVAERPDGEALTFNWTGTAWQADSDVDLILTQSGAGVGSTWTVKDHEDVTETYTQVSSTQAQLSSVVARNGYAQNLTYASGRLTSVTDSYSRSLSFSYSGNLLSSVSTPDSLTLTYGYDASGLWGTSSDRLKSVSYSTTPVTTQTYLYENAAFPFALTGITDENGNRYATWTYDGLGRATSSQHAGGADLTRLAYNTNGTVTVTDPLGVQTIYTFTILQSVPKVTKMARQASGAIPAATRTFTYDTNGAPATATDWNGNSTHYTNDAHGQPIQIIEAYGTAQARTTKYTYHPTFRLPLTKTESGLSTAYHYDPSGNLLTKVLTDTTTTSTPYSTNGQTRTWTYTWNGTGQLLTVQRPKGSGYKTTYAYKAGALTSITDALSHATTISSYTRGGLPLTSIDPNSVQTDFAYDGRLKLHTSTLHTSGGNRVTTYDHDAAGNLTKLTPPDGAYLTYVYDAAHRLNSTTKRGGNSQNFTHIDAAGDILETDLEISSGSIQGKHTAAFDALGRLQTDTGGAGQTTTYSYDSNNNITGMSDPLTHATSKAYDALNRVTSITDAASHSASYTYDAYDRPLTVTDKNGHKTTYVYNGFGDVIQETSPDRGTTVYTYDADANLVKTVDASASENDYTYDSLDRQLTRVYVGNTSINVALTYDQTGHGKGIGRLTSVTDSVGSHSRSYDERGAITTDVRTISGGSTLKTTYAYNPAGILSSITYPGSGYTVAYTRNSQDDIIAVTATPPGRSATTLASSIGYYPYGPMYKMTWGNGIVGAFSRDLDYRLFHITNTATAGSLQNIAYGYDADNNVHSIKDNMNPAASATLTYDSLDQLLTATSGTGGYGSQTYAYDAGGNRTRLNATAFTVQSTSNRLTAIGSSTVASTSLGNIKQIGTSTMTYDHVPRMSGATTAIANAYKYDAFGHLLTGANPGFSARVYQYGQDGNLLTETEGAETDYVYVGSLPIAAINVASGAINYIETDQIGRPIQATNASQATTWSAQYDPFGNTTPSGSVTISLRFPGQFWDNSGFYHNGARDYDPSQGRYLQYDPTGLNGGLNTYAYAGNNPLRNIDTQGLQEAQTNPGTNTSGPDPNIVGNSPMENFYGGVVDEVACSEHPNSQACEAEAVKKQNAGKAEMGLMEGIISSGGAGIPTAPGGITTILNPDALLEECLVAIQTWIQTRSLNSQPQPLVTLPNSPAASNAPPKQ